MSLEDSARIVHKLVEEVGRAVKRISPHRMITHIAMTLYRSSEMSGDNRPKVLSHFPPHLMSFLIEIHSFAARRPYDDNKLPSVSMIVGQPTRPILVSKRAH